MSFDVAIIGAGASGTLVAAHVARAGAQRVALVDAGARAARGLAYGTPYGAHLLNVPAGRMSAFVDDADHFVRWLRERDPQVSPAAFLPRPLYGEYLGDVLAASHVSRIAGTTVGLTRGDSGWTLHLADARRLVARNVVLALGNLPPADPLQLDRPPAGYVRDPWAPGVAVGLDRDAPVLLIGTGLTMIDIALALRTEGHAGPLYAISRRGLLPRMHAAYEPFAVETPPLLSPRRLLHWLRTQVRMATDWRAVIDALRPHTARIWQSWTLTERASFLRHARPFWEVHRHRVAPEIGARMESLELAILHGRIRAMTAHAEGVRIDWQRRGVNAVERLEVARVVNCTGPATDYARVDLPLVAHLRAAGWLVPDPLGLGVECDPTGRMLDARGGAIEGLFTIGPLRRPQLWESTAIPEIRAQAAELARLLGA